jgi:hypothetical protein
MSRWASKNIREQRIEIALRKHKEGWSMPDIAKYIGTPVRHVKAILENNKNRLEA